jgi:hypothetical protein
MGVKKNCAKNAEVQAYAHMVGGEITAKIVGGNQFVPMGGAKIFAKIAAEVRCVVMIVRSRRALFAVCNVLMAKRRASVMFVLKNANKSLFFVRMGSKKKDAPPAEKKSSCAHMANANIPAKNVGEQNIVIMGVSEIFARIAVGSPYVCMSARFIGAPFAVKNVSMA